MGGQEAGAGASAGAAKPAASGPGSGWRLLRFGSVLLPCACERGLRATPWVTWLRVAHPVGGGAPSLLELLLGDRLGKEKWEEGAEI